MNSQNIPIEDIPTTVLDQVENGLRHYFVPIVAHWKHKRAVPELKLIGSGTLIDIGGKGYIITAAHVWNAAAGADRLHLLVMAGRAKVEIPCVEISPKVIWERAGPEEWGPDIALLEIPPPQLATIRAYKSFLNFQQQLEDHSNSPPMIENTLWAMYGVVGEFSNVSVDPKKKSFDVELVARAFFCGITQTHSKGEFDYYDTRADLWLPGVPSSFGGVSGGSLWQVGLSNTKSGDLSWDGKRNFRGIAFWQSSAADEQRIVRFHGPRSIFERSWSEFGQSVARR